MLEWNLEGMEPYTRPVIPNPCVQIVVDGTAAHVMGVVTGPFAITLRGRGFAFGLRFRPGGFHPFWAGCVAELTDRRRPLQEVIPGVDEPALRRRAECADGDGLLASLEEALLAELTCSDSRAEQARAIAEMIATDGTLMTVAQVAEASALSVRALQRLFRTCVGVSPKWLIRRSRLQESAARAEAGEAPCWSDLAVSLGYYDQAHLIKDFTTIIGLPPAQYMRSIRAT